MEKEKIIPAALRTIELEKNAVDGLKAFINDDFVLAVEKISLSKGRLVVSGIGKSAIIAQKIVATLNSTGTPAIFMHAADAIHGDLGIIQQTDVVLVISKSGDSPEIKVLIPIVKNFGNTLIGMVGNMQSFLTQHSDIILNTTVLQEACPNNLAPTTSTTAQMVMGDALAVCLMETKGFRDADFARFHPGGTLGKKLYLRVGDLSVHNAKPQVLPSASIKEVIIEITQKRLGTTAVTDEANNMVGIITDGDLRRMLEKTQSFEQLTAKDIMNTAPKKIGKEELAVNALYTMQQNNISQLLVESGGKYAGIVHLHDLIKEGII